MKRFLLPLLLWHSLEIGLAAHATPDDAFLGRWALTIPGGGAGWIEIKREQGWFDGSILWGWGAVAPLSSVVIADGNLTVTRIRDVPRKDQDGAIIRTHQFTDVITARIEGDLLDLTRSAPRPDGSGFDRAEFTGHRIPPLPARPDLTKLKFGEPITLLNGRDLTGWRLTDSSAPNGWVMENGVLANRPPQSAGEPHKRYGNLRTEREFEDFRLTLDVKIPAKSNSGIYLRGIYEVQVLDSFGQPPDSRSMGSIYSRIAPAFAAERPSGEWQSLDILLVDRHVTVVLNRTTIIDNQPLAGCTGGALWSDESRPGPIYLQGDHGPVEFRDIVLRPVVK